MEFIVRNITGSRLVVRVHKKIIIFGPISEKDLIKEIGIYDKNIFDNILKQYHGRIRVIKDTTPKEEKKEVVDKQETVDTDEPKEKIFEVRTGPDKIIKDKPKKSKKSDKAEKVILD